MSLCTALEMLSFEGVRFGFQSLAHDNYNQWESSMRHLLSIQGIWEIVNGQVTKSELDHQGFELRDKLAVALIQATVDLHVHPWVPGQFTSSKELWDSIKCNSIKCQLQLQRKKKQKTKKKKKKKDKKQEPVLVVRSEISHLMLHVLEIHDSPSVSNCLENFLEEAACMKNAQVLDGSDFLHISQVSNLHTICENDCSLILKDVAAQTDESTTILRDKYEGYLLEVEENGIESAFFDQLSQDIIQQLEVPIFDDYLEVADLSSLVESFIPDYAAAELILECNVTPSKGAYESMYQKLEWFPSRHDHLSHASLVSWDEVFEHQVHTADFKHELADELVHIQQQQLDLPLYICLNVPFSCTHGGKLEDYPNLDHCLGYISYADIGGLTKQLKLSRSIHEMKGNLEKKRRSECPYIPRYKSTKFSNRLRQKKLAALAIGAAKTFSGGQAFRDDTEAEARNSTDIHNNTNACEHIEVEDSTDIHNNANTDADAGTLASTKEVLCVICHEDNQLVAEGVLACGHKFCFKCIHHWACKARTATCPLCKTPFDFITKKENNLPNGSLQSEMESIILIEEKEQTKQWLRPSRTLIAPTDLSCLVCQSRDTEDLLLVCGGCAGRATHTFCLDPPWSSSSSAPWLCNICNRRSFATSYIR